MSVTNKLLEHQVHILIFDIWKAFDHVDLNVLDKFILDTCIDEKVLEEWNAQKQDMENLDMYVEGTVIHRTRGIPQGGELSPFLFNYVTTCILKEIDKLNLSSEIIIYADNWVLLNTDKRNIENDYTIIEYVLKDYNFIIKEKPIIFSFDNIIVNSKSLEPILDDKDIRLLGLFFRNKNNSIELNIKPSTFKLKDDKSMDPHAAILNFKKFILPKYNYYYAGIKIWDEDIAKTYRNWFFKASNAYFERTAIIYKVPIEMLRNIIDGCNDKRTNYYWYYVSRFKNDFMRYDPVTDKLLLRWKSLSKWMYEKNKYIGIHTIINFLQDNKNRTPEEYIHSYIDNKNMKRCYANMDIAYNCIIARKDLNANMEYAQEIINVDRTPYIFDPINNRINN